jgi:hypothetical protein
MRFALIFKELLWWRNRTRFATETGHPLRPTIRVPLRAMQADPKRANTKK